MIELRTRKPIVKLTINIKILKWDRWDPEKIESNEHICIDYSYPI